MLWNDITSKFLHKSARDGDAKLKFLQSCNMKNERKIVVCDKDKKRGNLAYFTISILWAQDDFMCILQWAKQSSVNLLQISNIYLFLQH